jgi:hypothetical protein
MVPAETDVLCEGCGYTLNGLPETGNCPECGKEIDGSLGAGRGLTRWEIRPSRKAFAETTLAVLFAPRDFYGALATRVDTPQALRFAQWHRAIASVLFFAAAMQHFLWSTGFGTSFEPPIWLLTAMGLIGPGLVYLFLIGATSLAGWLSSLEARYWGMRLPHPIVRRGLQFHAACYLPVALLAVCITWGYRALLSAGAVSYASATHYLYALCAAVIVSAVYLFRMYWIAMKGMMYANR